MPHPHTFPQNALKEVICSVVLCGIPEEAPCRLQQLPDAHQLPLHILQLKEMAEDELVLSHGLLTDHNTQRPLNLQIMTVVALQQLVGFARLDCGCVDELGWGFGQCHSCTGCIQA